MALIWPKPMGKPILNDMNRGPTSMGKGQAEKIKVRDRTLANMHLTERVVQE